MTLFLQIVFFLLVGYLGLVAFMYFRQDSFIFFPVSARHENHGYQNIVDYSLERGEITLRGWLVNPHFAQEKLLVYFGGNAEDVFLNVDEYESVQAATLFVAYRGYGPSDGKSGEQELFADALAILDDMSGKYPGTNFYVIGRSLGSGVACYVASKREVQGLILVTPYDSIINVAKNVYPWLPVGSLLKHRFSSVDYISKVGSRVLVIYGGQDQVIRSERTLALIEHISAEKQVLCIPNADHGTVDMYPEYWQTIIEFISN